MHTNSVSKKHTWNYFTQTHGVWTLPANIRIYLIFLETAIIGLHFADDNIGLSSFRNFSGGLIYFVYFCKSDVSTFSRSRSSKVIEFGTNQKHVCDFILVHHSNLGPIWYRWQILGVTDGWTDRRSDDMQCHNRALLSIAR